MAEPRPVPLEPETAITPVPRPAQDLLRSMGLYGLDSLTPVLLAALATEEPLLLIGAHGTAKSLLLTRIAAALGLEFRHYNASLLNFDDLIGFPMPGKDGQLDYVRTPAAIWGAGAVIFDEISRCRPDIQNKLFPIIHERKVQGIDLAQLRFRWSAMNPPSTDDDDAYAGSEPLDTALADRFAFVVQMPEWEHLGEADQLAIIRARDVAVAPADAQRLATAIARTRDTMELVGNSMADGIAAYVHALVGLLAQAELVLSPRRAGMLFRSILAVRAASLALDPGADMAGATLLALRNAIPQRAQGIAVLEMKLLAAHRDAWRFACLQPDDPLKLILGAVDPVERFRLAVATPSLPRDEFSRVIADTLALLRPGARDAGIVHLFDTGAIGRLNAAIAEQSAARYQDIATAPEFSETLHAAQPRFRVWTRVKELLSQLDPDEPRDQLCANALAAAFSRNELAAPEDAQRFFEDYISTAQRLEAA